MEGKEKNEFLSLEDKCQYYITEYETYKLKYISLNEEYERVLENNKKLYENINNERKLRKELEEKLKYTNLTNNNSNININGNDNEKIKIKNIFQEDLIILDKDMETGEDELLNINNEIKSKNLEFIRVINFSFLSKNNQVNKVIEDEKNINKINQINKDNLIKNEDSNKDNKQSDKIKAKGKELNENILTQDFLNYSKESISLLNSLYRKESKIDKIYNFLKKFLYYLKILKRGAILFNKSISLFTEHLSIYNNENKNILSDWPFLSEFIFIVQKSFSTINIYCSSLITTIDSSCIIQINDIIGKQMKNLFNIRNKIKTKKEEFYEVKSDFLSNKHYEQEKNKYYKEYLTYELLKYDYFSTVNKFLILIKLKFPEILSLLIYSYITYFSTVTKELKQINDTVRKNLESLLNATSIKNKIETGINIYRKKIIDDFQIFDKTKKQKEGFLFLKEKDGSKFSKRYVQILNGHLIYYKLKKNVKSNFMNLDNKIFINFIDYVDIETKYDICQLLFSNVKKCIKSHYPFCFEVNVASTKACYIFQADTEYEMEEWISSITNAISGQISDFKENKIDINNENNNNDKDINNDFINEENEEELIEIKNKNLVMSLIENNICADCGAEKPTWLNINWITLLCVDCSGIHRSLGVQISKIRSLELDNINNDYLDLLFMIKQTDINQILEEKLNESGDQKPKFDDSREEKEKFIINKYKIRKYMNFNQNNNKEEVIQNIFDNIKDDNLDKVFRLIKTNNIDINGIYSYNNEEWGFLHYCAKFDKLFLLKLFYILGADTNLKDKKGLKPIDYVIPDEQKQIYDYLKD